MNRLHPIDSPEKCSFRQTYYGKNGWKYCCAHPKRYSPNLDETVFCHPFKFPKHCPLLKDEEVTAKCAICDKEAFHKNTDYGDVCNKCWDEGDAIHIFEQKWEIRK